MSVVVDYGYLIASGSDERRRSRVAPERLAGDLGDRFRQAHEQVRGMRARLGFFDLPHATEAPAGAEEEAACVRRRFEHVVVLGIGGSALGARTLRDALARPAAHPPACRLHIADNVDPDSLSRLLGQLDLAATLFNVVSKSGATTETLAQYLVVAERLIRVLGRDRARQHLLFTTDPVEGPLRRLAATAGVRTLPVPPAVGGRFSVLSPVGLFPAAAAGIDIRRLLTGAARMERRCRTPVLANNPAGVLAVLLHRADVECGRRVHVFMPYCDRLRSFALWVQQLWGESLGKAGQTGQGSAETGPTPLVAAGATDQHSLLQLLMEGPPDKIVCFFTVEARENPVPVPKMHRRIPAFAALGGLTLQQLMAIEHAATAAALHRVGRPNLTLRLAKLDEETLGELIMLFQVATVYAASLYGVDPLGQPGVELGKRLIHRFLDDSGGGLPNSKEANRRRMV